MSSARGAVPVSRWWLVAVAAAAMGIAGTYQFVWSSLRGPLGVRLGTSEAALGTVFTLFVVFQTVSQFPAGWVRDRWGPRLPLAAGALLVALGYVGTAFAPTLPYVYLSYSLGGVGAGIAYTVAINTPVKWFRERRGLATGVVTMTYGGLSFLLIPVIRPRLDANFGATLLGVGLLAGLVVLAGTAVIKDPPDDAGAAGEEDDGEGDDGDPDGGGEDDTDDTWREAVRTWQFWLLYAVFVAVNGVGLMVIGKVVSFAEALGLPATTATGAASIVALADAAGIIVIGGASDRFGRERTIAAALVLCGVSLGAAVFAGTGGLGTAFVALVGAFAFFRSPAFAIFPSIVGEYYGEGHSSENYALLYTAKLWGGVLGGTAASALVVALGWPPTFLLGAGVIGVAGVAAILLRPV